jgi:hypothetical protein
MYVPSYWSHGVLNLAESIGVAAEFKHSHHERVQFDDLFLRRS